MHLLFDLDGTLVDSLPGITNALNHALEERGFPRHSKEAVRTFIGHGTYHTARCGTPAGESDQVAREIEASFRMHYANHWKQGTSLYPGISRVIEELQRAGQKLAVVSNKPHRYTVETVEHFFPAESFSQIIGQQDGISKKPAPDMVLKAIEGWGTAPEHCIFIGDSSIDRETASNAGIRFVAVGWGYHDPDVLGEVIAMDDGQLLHLLQTQA